MTEKTAQSVANLGYHAHIYYDPARTRAVVERVCAALGEKFRVEIAEFQDTPRGPHPISNTVVIFKPEEFEHVVPYLMLNRDGLDVPAQRARRLRRFSPHSQATASASRLATQVDAVATRSGCLGDTATDSATAAAACR